MPIPTPLRRSRRRDRRNRLRAPGSRPAHAAPCRSRVVRRRTGASRAEKRIRSFRPFIREATAVTKANNEQQALARSRAGRRATRLHPGHPRSGQHLPPPCLNGKPGNHGSAGPAPEGAGPRCRRWPNWLAQVGGHLGWANRALYDASIAFEREAAVPGAKVPGELVPIEPELHRVPEKKFRRMPCRLAPSLATVCRGDGTASRGGPRKASALRGGGKRGQLAALMSLSKSSNSEGDASDVLADGPAPTRPPEPSAGIERGGYRGD